MIDGILFDKDGTLFDFRRSWASWAEGLMADLASEGASPDAVAQALGFVPGAKDFRPDSVVIAGTVVEVAVALSPLVPALGLADLTARINALASRTPMVPAVPLRPVLSALRERGIRIGLATNDAEAPARAHLTAHGVLDLFDFVAGFDSGFGAKPGPGMPLAFVEAMGIAPGRAAMVGDSRHDLVAGREAGVLAIAVLTGIAVADDLRPFADAVLPDIGHLGRWIDGLAD